MGKLVDRSKPSVFIGYAEGEKAYRILDPLTQRVKVACDVVFDEGHGWDWSKPDPSGSASAASDFTVESWWPRGAGGAQIFGGGWTFITSVAYTTTSVALTVTKSEGAQSHIGSSMHSSSATAGHHHLHPQQLLNQQHQHMAINLKSSIPHHWRTRTIWMPTMTMSLYATAR